MPGLYYVYVSAILTSKSWTFADSIPSKNSDCFDCNDDFFVRQSRNESSRK